MLFYFTLKSSIDFQPHFIIASYCKVTRFLQTTKEKRMKVVAKHVISWDRQQIPCLFMKKKTNQKPLNLDP